MPNSLNAASLAATLKEKTQSDREAVQRLTSNELEKLGDALRQRYSDELNSTLDGINAKLASRLNSISKKIDSETAPLITALEKVKAEGQRLERLSLRAWMRPVLIGLCLLATISLGSWGLTLYLSGTITDQLQQIQSQRETLAAIEAKTWGLEFSESKNGRFLVLPKGTKAVTGWTSGKREAVKLETE